MNKNRFAKRLAVAAGFFFLCAAPGLTRAQSSAASPAPTPHQAPLAARPKVPAPLTPDYTGFTFTDEQKERMDQIHQEMKSRMDAVAKNGKLTAQQRDAMLESYRRSERTQVFKVLTTAQQKEVFRRARARRAAEERKPVVSAK
jgi:hypothetical protein